ncbi:hypothetical protein DM01DRAFT_1163536 [Hesseltinella vesiculosa]|uniref:C2H2-type domain-containing protein n=1 Tax=Hesseltinella vesiculosa TaxID=101127 RepID=A0A1X2GT39_9FUNG|nr:hypothetical protein DM01DRAFT_1163536 [Hesseltinella vesiculosa]
MSLHPPPPASQPMIMPGTTSDYSSLLMPPLDASTSPRPAMMVSNPVSHSLVGSYPAPASSVASYSSALSISSTTSLPLPSTSPIPSAASLGSQTDMQSSFRANSTSPCVSHGYIVTDPLMESSAMTSTFFSSPAAVPKSPSLPFSIHHHKRRSTSPASSISSAPTKTYACHFCDKVFHRAYNLKSHLLSHSKARPYVCRHEDCPWRFSRPHDLRRHEALHSGHRPFACGTCGKRFARKEALQRHARGDAICLRVANMLAHAASISNDVTLAPPQNHPL